MDAIAFLDKKKFVYWFWYNVHGLSTVILVSWKWMYTHGLDYQIQFYLVLWKFIWIMCMVKSCGSFFKMWYLYICNNRISFLCFFLWKYVVWCAWLMCCSRISNLCSLVDITDQKFKISVFSFPLFSMENFVFSVLIVAPII